MSRYLHLFLVQDGDGTLLLWLKEGLLSLLIVALFWGLSLLVRYLLTVWGPRFTAVTKTDLDDRILKKITPPVSLLVLTAGLFLAVRSLPLPEKVHPVVAGTLFIVNVFILTNISYRSLHELLEWYATRMAERGRGGLDQQLLPLAEKLGILFLIFTALMITLKHFNYDILSFATATRTITMKSRNSR